MTRLEHNCVAKSNTVILRPNLKRDAYKVHQPLRSKQYRVTRDMVPDTNIMAGGGVRKAYATTCLNYAVSPDKIQRYCRCDIVVCSLLLIQVRDHSHSRLTP